MASVAVDIRSGPLLVELLHFLLIMSLTGRVTMARLTGRGSVRLVQGWRMRG